MLGVGSDSLGLESRDSECERAGGRTRACLAASAQLQVGVCVQ